MGMLIDGRWTDEDPRMSGEGGRFQRPRSTFRAAIGDPDHPPEPGRYHLFTSPTCPWAQRAVIVRRLKHLEGIISSTEADQPKHQGWTFSEGLDGFQPEAGRMYLHRVYTAVEPSFTGRVTVPVLWDRQSEVIVNNESSEIIRMLDTAFVASAPASARLCPDLQKAEIEEMNAWLYDAVNNGVYRCGYAKTQEAYEQAFTTLFAALDSLDARLARRRYLMGDAITECDVRLFTTLVRFDAVYLVHFKCNRNRISDFAHLGPYLRDLYQTPGFGDTVDMRRIKHGYFAEHRHINPSGLVPCGPELNFDAPHDRYRLNHVS